MSDAAEGIIYRHYCPPGVKRVLASGSSAFVGEVDDSTVLKYPLAPGGDLERLEVERKLLEIIGPHPRIIGYRGFSDQGLYLERAANGTLADYILEPGNPLPTIHQRLRWCLQAAEAVAHIHFRGVLHCDIQPTNLLLDKDLGLKLSDFQGQQVSGVGEGEGEGGGPHVLLEGGSSEPCRFYLPRDDPFSADTETDLFALGCTLYFVMMGHAVFPDIVDGTEGWQEKVVERFAGRQFPQDLHACSRVTRKCWLREYGSTREVVEEIEAIVEHHGDG